MNKNLVIGIFAALVILVGGWLLLRGQGVQPNPSNGTVGENPLPSDQTVTETPSGSIPESTDSSAANEVKEFTVTGSNFKFDVPEIKVNKGDTVKITFKNAAGFHNFVIDEFNVKTKQGNGPSEETVTFVAEKAGEFAFYCSVGQHRSLGMEGKFIVE